MIIHVQIINLCRHFRVSLSVGDGAMLEILRRKFLLIFVLTKMKNYANIVPDVMDSLCSNISINQLKMVRINRTVPLCNVTDHQGIHMANCALDDVIELIKKYYHQMNFKSGNG